MFSRILLIVDKDFDGPRPYPTYILQHYWNKSWSIIRQGLFQLWEVNQMEKEMCQCLNWELDVELLTWYATISLAQDCTHVHPANNLQAHHHIDKSVPHSCPNKSTSPIPSFSLTRCCHQNLHHPLLSIPINLVSSYISPPATFDTLG